MTTPHRWTLAAGVLVFATIWARPEPVGLWGVDAGCYARIAKEIAERPLSDWPNITWGGERYYEHPPLALWIESVAFRVAGPSARTAVTLARMWATLAALLTALVAFRLAGDRVAGLSLIALVTFGGFLNESQNPMFEIALTACMALCFVAVTQRRGRAPLFALGFVAAFFIKGPPALAVFAPLVWHVGVREKQWRSVFAAAGLALTTVAIAVYGFEHARAVRGLDPYFATYLERQVLASFTAGRHNPDSNPLFYLGVLATSYGPFVVALPFAIWKMRRHRLFELGALWVLAIVCGFSLAKQKYGWYVHPAMFGAAWVCALAADAFFDRLPERLRARVPAVLAIVGALWLAVTPWIDAPSSPTRGHTAALARIAWPEAAAPRIVADCAALGEWRAIHLFAFHWGAKPRPCDDTSAPFRFDGERLTPAR
ncbi:MAG: glycosyltransferase family 39 protein [Deltaproteobacteria bacterium]|nr:glycosyltransferase family 39 protein [Deltaproteobacteria bacterium]